MAVASGDIDFYLSVTSGTGPGGTDAGTPAGSLGEFRSSTQITDASLHNLFDVVTGDENAASDVEYRCLFICNANATDTLFDAVVWINSQVSGGAAIAIGLDPVGVVADDAASAQAATIANESAVPAGVSFTTPTTKGGGLAIGDLEAGECIALWVRRTAANTAALDDDGATIRVEGDTGE